MYTQHLKYDMEHLTDMVYDVTINIEDILAGWRLKKQSCDKIVTSEATSCPTNATKYVQSATILRAKSIGGRPLEMLDILLHQCTVRLHIVWLPKKSLALNKEL